MSPHTRLLLVLAFPAGARQCVRLFTMPFDAPVVVVVVMVVVVMLVVGSVVGTSVGFRVAVPFAVIVRLKIYVNT